ncbi:DUF4912 domain-containing protein [Metabacillus arenae]|uniref:DUF4912 domain-containing protein n=1 Tax=Metabacillus arenae TaxID=2771434 RepID=A0A926NJA6_9BACI|nr:DUF4912 domain-containing protein [Metabacillus arenae]MBD1378891.1 DUF4912 domain-containing protein [Metabacillus arenae]
MYTGNPDFGEDWLRILPKNEKTIYSYWNVSLATSSAVEFLLKESDLLMIFRLFQKTNNEQKFQDLYIPSGQNSLSVTNLQGKFTYYGELLLYNSLNHSITISRSNEIILPVNQVDDSLSWSDLLTSNHQESNFSAYTTYEN